MSNSLSNKILYEGLAFDDVLVLPRYSEVLPREVTTRTKLTRNLEINVPILSAAMDTVTEGRMAISMARAGGIGFIHKNMTIERQAAEVKKVKRSESGMIKDPVTLRISATLSEAMAAMKDYRIGGIPIIDNDGKLVGILTNRDLRFQTDMSRSVDEVMTKHNLITAEVGTDLQKAMEILQQHRIEKLPVIDKDGFLKGLKSEMLF
jgi:IMP dehydrogenase